MCVVVVLVFLGGREQSAPLCGGFSRHSVCDGEFPVPGPNPQASGREAQGQAPPGAEAEQLHLTPPPAPPAEWLFLRPFKSSQSRLHVSSLGSKTRPQQNPAYRQPARRFLHFNRLSTDERRVRQRAAGPPGLGMWLLLKRLELHPLLPTTKFFKGETERTAAPLTFRQSALV